MSNLHQRQDFRANNERVLARLAWAIEASQGQFSLLLAHCNYASLREQLIRRLQEFSPVPIRIIALKNSVNTLYTTIRDELGDEKPAALMVSGLELVRDIDRVLLSTNQVREEFRKNFPFPLVLWVTDEIVEKLIRLAPDFESWATSIVFAIATDTLIERLRQGADYLFSRILELGAERFLSNDVILCSHHHYETCAALRDLRERGEELSPELQASLDFVLGRDAYARDEIEAALDLYDKSLAFWKQETKKEENWKTPTSNIQNLKLKQGVLLFHIGLCYCRQAERYGTEECYCWEEARRYLQQCVDLFEQAQRQDLVAKFITQLGEVLQNQKAWNDLHNLAQKSLVLHQTYHSPVQLAQDYGFLAEVAIEQSRWMDANQAAQTALELIEQVSPEQRRHQNFYLLLLARSQQELGEYGDAITNLEKARAIGSQDNPHLYIRILKTLQMLYCEQKNYLEAFRVKQDRRSVEQQYGLRAFIGAGRIKAQRQAWSALAPTELQAMVAQEITASGRQQDIERLIERIGSTQHKLTVLYGQSGVGKSSMVDAGLVPALKQRAIGTRDVLPIRLRVYTNWVKELGKELVKALVDVGISVEWSVHLNSSEAIIEQLRQNEHRNLLTVLIFDQFEEFFFVCKEHTQRERFAEFFHDCLDIPFLKVILSLREDYLHLLLRCSRHVKLDAINNNILDKDILYYVGNFTPEDAKSIIHKLTQRSQFCLEPALVEALVTDLAGEEGEVRPIELQVVGAQLQTENITTLAQYQEHGPKEKLVQRYLEEVVKDSGVENQRVAELVLYLLTDENNTRPLKTRAELEGDLKELTVELTAEPDKLGLVLRIFVESGLVFLLPEIPAERYQLVHDYLVTFIRQQQEPKIKELTAELEAEKSKRLEAEAREKQAEQAAKILAEANQNAKRRIRVGVAVLISSFALAGAASGVAGWQSQQASEQHQNLVSAQAMLETVKKDYTKTEREKRQTTALLKQEQGRVQEIQRRVDEKSQTAKLAEEKVKVTEQEEQRAQEAYQEAQQKANVARRNLGSLRVKLQEVTHKAQAASQQEKSAQKELAKARQEQQQEQERVRLAKAEVEKTRVALQKAKDDLELTGKVAQTALGKKGETTYQLGRYEEALDDFNSALKLNPEYTFALAGRGETYRLMERYEEALKDFSRAIELDPKYAWAIGSRGQVYHAMQNYAQALVDLNHAIELDSTLDWAICARGETYRLMERYEEALKDFNRAIQLNPEYADALGSRGQVYRAMQNYEQALVDLNHATELDPTLDWAIAERGETYRLVGRYEEALKDFNRALELDPKYTFALSSRGQTYRQMEQYEKALADLNHAIELDPKLDWAITERGETYRLMERYEEALADFNHALELDPKLDWAITSRGYTYLELLRYEQALADFTRTLELDPKNVFALSGRGNAYREMEHYDKALDDFNQAIKLGSDSELDKLTMSELISVRGWIYRQMGRYEEALANFKSALELNPKQYLALEGRGETYRYMRRYKEALDDFNHAIELDTKNVWPIYNRALVYLALRQKDQGQADLNKAIQSAQQRYEKDTQNWLNLGSQWRNGFNVAIYYLAAGKTEQAERQYQKLLSKKPSTYILREAIRDLDDFLFLFPEHPQAKSMRELLQATLK